MNRTIYEKNCELWSRLEPEGAQAIQANDTHNIEICTSKNGQLNLKLVDGGKSRFYHDENDPLQEAEKWLSTLDLKSANVLFVYGVGLGYYYDALTGWLKRSPDNYLVFIEDNPEVLQRLFETEHAEKLLKDPQVRIYYLNEFRKGSEKFDKITSNFMGASFKVSANQLYLRTKSEELVHLNTILSFMMNMKMVLHEEFRNFGLAFYRNYFTSLYTLPQSCQAKSLWGEFKGVPAIICGAGPSLNKNIGVLKTLQQRALILAGSTAVNALNAEGINPHFGVGIDPNPEQLARIVSNQAFQTPFFINFRMNSYAMNAVHGDHLYVGSGGSYKVGNWLDDQLHILGPNIIEGYNVVNYTLSIARELGCNPIILVGVDLAYSEGDSYAKLLPEHPLYRGTSKFSTKSSQEDLVAQQDIYGNSVFTLWKWLLESVWFSNFALSNPGITLINATEGGLGFPGVEQKTLAQMADEELKCEYDFEGMIHADIRAAKMPEGVTRENIIKLLKGLKESLVHCTELCQEIAKEYKQLSREMEKGGDFPEKLETEEIDRSIARLESENAYAQILSSFNDHLIKAVGKGLERLNLDQEWLTLAEIYRQHADLHYLRYSTLQEASSSIASVLETSLNIYQMQIEREKKCGIVDQSKFLKGISEASSEEIYSINDGILTIVDPFLGINFSEPFDISNPAHHNIEYYANGTMKSEQYYLDGKLHGSSSYWAIDGGLLAKRWYIHGYAEGKALCYYSNQKPYSITRYRHGVPQGPQEYYYESGLLRSRFNCQNGEFDGPLQLFYVNGQLKREINYCQGKREGIETLWSFEGEKLGQVEYHDDLPVGEAKFWGTKGNVLKCVTFDQDGKLLKTELWDEEGRPLEIAEQGTGDYFDMVTKKIQTFTNNLDLIAEGIAKLMPSMEGNDKRGDIPLGKLKTDLIHIQTEVKNLKEIVQVMANQVGLNPNNPREAIWKTPTMQKMVEDMIEKISVSLKDNLTEIEKAFMKVLEHAALKGNKNHKK